MRRHVSTWEELPKGVWLDNDESGVHWYQANDGTYWHSADDGYRVWEEIVQERQVPVVQSHTKAPQNNFDDDYFSRYDYGDDNEDDDDYLSGSFRRRKFPFVTVAVVLILIGGGGAAGYFIYDFFNQTPEEEFYGTVYWGYSDGEVYGYLFTGENRLDAIIDDEECDSDGDRYRNSEHLCIYNFAEMFGDLGWSYSLVEKGANFEMCIDSDCVDLYPLNRGLVMDEGEDCVVLVSDIGTPTFTLYDDGDITSYDLSESWKDKYQDIVEDIEKNLPASC